MSGFDCLNFSQLVQRFPSLLKPLFVEKRRKKLTASFFNIFFMFVMLLTAVISGPVKK